MLRDRKQSHTVRPSNMLGVPRPTKLVPKNSKNERKKVAQTRKFKRKPKISCSVHNLVRNLIKSSQGMEIKLGDYKGVRVSKTMFVPDEESLNIANEFVSLNTVYEFRLAGHATVNSVSGVVDTFIATDPSSSGWNCSEWSTLSSLFSEFRVKHFQVQLCRSNWDKDSTVNPTQPTYLVCANLGTAVAPGSYAAVADNADSKLWAAWDCSPHGYTHKMDCRGIGWSQVTTPTTEPFAGAPGSIQIYGSFGNSNTTGILHLLISGVYEFRSRV